MNELRQRAPRQEDPKHLAFVRTQPCCIRGCRRQAEPAHIRFACPAIGKPETGMQQKPDDRYVTPLCPYHHRIGIDCQHNSNEREWWAMRGLNPFAIAADLWKRSGGEDRAAQAKVPTKPKKIKARKPASQRKKIAAGRPLKSNPVIQSRPFPTRRRETATGFSS